MMGCIHSPVVALPLVVMCRTYFLDVVRSRPVCLPTKRMKRIMAPISGA